MALTAEKQKRLQELRLAKADSVKLTRDQRIQELKQLKQDSEPVAPQELGLLDRLEGVTSAPIRRDINRFLEGESLGDVISGHEFFVDPRTIPDDETVSKKFGLSETGIFGEPGTSTDPGAPELGIPGVGIPEELQGTGAGPSPQELAREGMNFLGQDLVLGPGARALSRSARFAKGTKLLGPKIKGVDEFLSKGVDKVTGLVGQASDAVVGKIGDIGATLGTVTGVPKRLIKNFARNVDKFEGEFKRLGNSTAARADEVKRFFVQRIDTTKRQLNAVITKAIESGDQSRKVSLRPVIESLEASKKGLNPQIPSHKEAINIIEGRISLAKNIGLSEKESSAINQLQESIVSLKSQSKGKPTTSVIKDPLTGNLTKRTVKVNSELTNRRIQEAQDALDILQKKADNVTVKNLHDLHQDSNEFSVNFFQNTFEGGKPAPPKAVRAVGLTTGETRKLLRTHAPEITEANQQLSRIHKLRAQANKSLFKVGSPEAGLLRAGENEASRERNALRLLGKLTGDDFVGKSEDLATFGTFAKPTALGGSGRIEGSIRRGAATASPALANPAQIVAIGIQSPKILKGLIQAGNFSVKSIRKITGAAGKITDDVIELAYRKIVENPSLISGEFQAVRAAATAPGFVVPDISEQQNSLKKNLSTKGSP